MRNGEKKQWKMYKTLKSKQWTVLLFLGLLLADCMLNIVYGKIKNICNSCQVHHTASSKIESNVTRVEHHISWEECCCAMLKHCKYLWLENIYTGHLDKQNPWCNGQASLETRLKKMPTNPLFIDIVIRTYYYAWESQWFSPTRLFIFDSKPLSI